MRTRSGASSGMRGPGRGTPSGTPSGTSCSSASAASMAATLRRTISGPRRPQVASTDSLTAAIASSRGSTPDSAKKQVDMTVLIRRPSPCSLGDLLGVDHPQVRAAFDQHLLGTQREAVPELVRGDRRVHQHRRTGRGAVEHVEAVQEVRGVDRQEVGALHLVGGADRPRPEAQVRHRGGARLLGVVDEVALAVQVGAVADDLDRRLVGADRAVGTQPVEQRPGDPGGLVVVAGLDGQRQAGHVVGDADREPPPWGAGAPARRTPPRTMAGVNSLDDSP